MKEIVIPFTWEHVMKGVVLTLTSLTICGIILGLSIHEHDVTLFSLIMGGFITLFITMICSMNYEWDMNPFHKIGYCIRLAESWELKKPINTSQKESTK